LPFQEGRALATITEGLTELVEASSDELATCQVLMAEEGEDDAPIPIGALTGFSKMKTPLTLATRMTPSATRGVQGTWLVQSEGDGPTSACVLRSASSTPNSLLQANEASGLPWPTLLG
jgi:hypothetical protein